jgi:hypothetical protein
MPTRNGMAPMMRTINSNIAVEVSFSRGLVIVFENEEGGFSGVVPFF